MTSASKPHLTIIGAGIVGISTAHHAQREGFSVTVIDKVPPGKGCSYGNAGGVVPASVMPDFHRGVLAKIPGWLMDPLGPLTIRWSYLPAVLPWMLKAARNTLPARQKAISSARGNLSLRVMQDYDDILKAAGIRHMLSGNEAIIVYDTDAQYRDQESVRKVFAEHGYPRRKLLPGELAELEPDAARDFHCAEFQGGWWHLANPFDVVDSLARMVAGAGGEILEAEVVSLAHDGSRATQLTLADGVTRPIDRLAVCAGAYSHLLAKQLGTTVPLEAERGYHIMIDNPGVSPSRTFCYAPRPGAVTPMNTGLRIAGTDEFAGLDAAPNWKRADNLWPIGKRMFPALRELDADTPRWMGRRPGLPDTVPVISASPGLSNVWYGFGHGHLGITWGPTTGRMLAEMMAGKPANIDLAPYRADRF